MIPSVDVCFSPLLYPVHENKNAIVVVVDILRASSSICAAFMNNVNSIIPVSTLEEARNYKDKGFIVAAERDGIKIDFADFGNSPQHFTKERVAGKTIVYSTTNGTKIIKMAAESKLALIGAFSNLDALANFLIRQNNDVVIFCAGWKKRFNLEDSLFAGALSEILINSNQFSALCDATLASIDLWNTAKLDVAKYTNKLTWTARLGMPEVLNACMQTNITDKIPYYKEEQLICF